MVKFRKCTLAHQHDGVGLKLVGRVLLFVNVTKSTRKSTHGSRLYGAQGLHIAFVLGVCGLEYTSEQNYFLSHDIQHILYLVQATFH